MAKRFRALVFRLCMPILLCLLIGCERGGDVIVLKLAHSLDVEHSVHKAMVYMADLVAENSDGRMRVDVYPSEQLGSERECIEQVQLGILAMTKTSSGPMEGFVPAMRVFGLPYLFDDSEHMWEVFNGPIGKEILTLGEPKGLRGMCYYDAGARSFYTTKVQIKSPPDLAGLKIRVLKSEMSVRMIDAMGGTPTPIDWGELYTSLQQGVVDGAENNPPSFYLSNHYEICPYYTLDEHLRLPDILVMNPDIYHGLPEDLQKILDDAVAESVDYQRKLWIEMEQDALSSVREAGVEVLKPDKAPFREAVQPVWDEFKGTQVGDLAEQIQQAR